MTWIKTNKHLFNLDHLSCIKLNAYASTAEVYAANGTYMLDLDQDDTIALVSAIEELGIKDTTYLCPVEENHLINNEVTTLDPSLPADHPGVPF